MQRKFISQFAEFHFVIVGVFLQAGVGLTIAAETASNSVNSAIVPVSRLEQDAYDWFGRHSEVLELQKKLDPEIVMIGDSITHFWGGEPHATQNGPKAWSDTFRDHRVLNMGFGWDRTQNVMWRLDHREMDDTHPKVVVLNIGTNNFAETPNAHANTPAEVAEAISMICDRINTKSPTSRIVVMGIFPRGATADDPVRSPITETNRLLAKQLANKHHITLIDLSNKFLQPDGTLSHEIMRDTVHPTEKGYTIWGNALIAAGVLK